MTPLEIVALLRANTKLIVYSILLAVLLYAGYRLEKHGYDRCDVIYQAHLAADKAAIESTTKLSEETNAIVQLQHEHDKAAVKSKAGSAAIDGYIRSHGLLSGCPTLQPVSAVQASGDKSYDAASSEQRSGEGIKGFAERCAADAMMVGEWQAWATGNALPVK